MDSPGASVMLEQPEATHSPSLLLGPTAVSVIWLTLTPVDASVHCTPVAAVSPVFDSVTV